MAVEFGVIDHIDRQKVPIHQTFDERIDQIGIEIPASRLNEEAPGVVLEE